MRFRVVLPLAVLAALAGLVLAVDPPLRALPPVTVGKETTVVDGPFEKGGTIDYEAALNAKLKGKATAETNAAVLLLTAIGPKPEGSDLHADFYKQLGIAPLPEKGDYIIRQGEVFEEELQGEDAQAFWDREGELRTRPWTAKEEPKFADWLAVNEAPLKLVAEAVRRPDYHYPLIARRDDGTRSNLINVLLPMTQRCREMASILSLRVMLRCGEKKYDAAWRDIVTMHRLGRHVSRGGCLIELLVGIAIDAIANRTASRFLEVAKPTAKQALSWRDELLALPPLATVAEKIDLFERFMFLDCAQHARRDGFGFLRGLIDQEIPEGAKEAVEAALLRLDWDRVLKSGNKWFDRTVAAMRKPIRTERQKELGLLDAERKKMKAETDFEAIMKDSMDERTRGAASDRMGALFYAMLGPVFQKVTHARERIEVMFATEVLAFALAAYHADHRKYPAKLTDLVPKYAASIPGDVFSGKGLIYKPTDKGYELYSVGTNEKDDGGHMFQDDPPGDDFGLRMPFSKKAWPKPEDAPGGLFPGGLFPPGGGPKK